MEHLPELQVCVSALLSWHLMNDFTQWEDAVYSHNAELAHMKGFFFFYKVIHTSPEAHERKSNQYTNMEQQWSK